MDEATKVTEEAIRKADKGADPDWKDRALIAVEQVANEKGKFTTDDVWKRIEYPREGRAMGAVMRRSKLIEPTSEFILSERPECHKRPLRVWKLIA
jgi:hypothetical protein